MDQQNSNKDLHDHLGTRGYAASRKPVEPDPQAGELVKELMELAERAEARSHEELVLREAASMLTRLVPPHEEDGEYEPREGGHWVSDNRHGFVFVPDSKGSVVEANALLAEIKKTTDRSSQQFDEMSNDTGRGNVSAAYLGHMKGLLSQVEEFGPFVEGTLHMRSDGQFEVSKDTATSEPVEQDETKSPGHLAALLSGAFENGDWGTVENVQRLLERAQEVKMLVEDPSFVEDAWAVATWHLAYLEDAGEAADDCDETNACRRLVRNAEPVVRNMFDAADTPIVVDQATFMSNTTELMRQARATGQEIEIMREGKKVASVGVSRRPWYRPVKDTFDEIAAELNRARAKFPTNEHKFAALVEEVGELSQALLQGKPDADIRAEAIQVACMAIRVADEGCSTFPDAKPFAARKTPNTFKGKESSDE